MVLLISRSHTPTEFNFVVAPHGTLVSRISLFRYEHFPPFLYLFAWWHTRHDTTRFRGAIHQNTSPFSPSASHTCLPSPPCHPLYGTFRVISNVPFLAISKSGAIWATRRSGPPNFTNITYHTSQGPGKCSKRSETTISHRCI